LWIRGPQIPATPPARQAPGYGHPGAALRAGGAEEPRTGTAGPFFISGLGSLVIGRIGVGIGIMVGYFIALLFSMILIGLPFLLGFWIWGMCDAYAGAKNWNARHGIIS
jgi:hypothetical protein